MLALLRARQTAGQHVAAVPAMPQANVIPSAGLSPIHPGAPFPPSNLDTRVLDTCVLDTRVMAEAKRKGSDSPLDSIAGMAVMTALLHPCHHWLADYCSHASGLGNEMRSLCRLPTPDADWPLTPRARALGRGAEQK